MFSPPVEILQHPGLGPADERKVALAFASRPERKVDVPEFGGRQQPPAFRGFPRQQRLHFVLGKPLLVAQADGRLRLIPELRPGRNDLNTVRRTAGGKEGERKDEAP